MGLPKRWSSKADTASPDTAVLRDLICVPLAFIDTVPNICDNGAALLLRLRPPTTWVPMLDSAAAEGLAAFKAAAPLVVATRPKYRTIRCMSCVADILF